MSNRSSPIFIAAMARAEYLALAAFCERQVLEVRQHRLRVGQRTPAYLGTLITDLARDYAAQYLVLEPGSFLAATSLATPLVVKHCPLRRGEHWLMGTTAVSSEEDLCQRLVDKYPELRRLVTVYPRTGQVAHERWNITQLFTVALGLTYAETVSPSRSPHSTPLIFSSLPSYASSTHSRTARRAHEV